MIEANKVEPVPTSRHTLLWETIVLFMDCWVALVSAFPRDTSQKVHLTMFLQLEMEYLFRLVVDFLILIPTIQALTLPEHGKRKAGCTAASSPGNRSEPSRQRWPRGR
jgi:hypothetical protein